jgi:hypothetical protein
MARAEGLEGVEEPMGAPFGHKPAEGVERNGAAPL